MGFASENSLPLPRAVIFGGVILLVLDLSKRWARQIFVNILNIGAILTIINHEVVNIMRFVV